MNVLVFNVGSTTLKFACLNSSTGERVCDGQIDRIGQPDGDADSHAEAARIALQQMQDVPFSAVGHRIVQGGSLFQKPTIVDSSVLAKLKKLDALAPLHNPPARKVVESLSDLDVPQTLVFDTAYFATLSPEAYRYAIPENLYRDHHVRRYGFHGTSHQYVTQRALDFLDDHSTATKIISLHLGGGASVTASIGGVAIDTSMGMTPLEGLVMATRCGDIDPAVPLYLIRELEMTVSEVDNLLNRQSGLLGLCGSSDMRTVLQRCAQGDDRSVLAIDIYVRQIVKTVGSFFAVLGGLDAIIYTAGIGEHSAEIRQRIATPLAHLGIAIDDQLNQNRAGTINEISSRRATVRSLVVATDEELAIAKQVYAG